MVSVVSRIQEYLSPSRKYYSSSHLSQWKSIVSGINIAFSLLKVLSCIFLFTLTLKNNVLSPPRPSYFVLYNTLESDVALAYLPMATVTIAVVEMIMSLVLDHENKKLIWRALNLVHEVEFNEKWKAWSQSLAWLKGKTKDPSLIRQKQLLHSWDMWRSSRRGQAKLVKDKI